MCTTPRLMREQAEAAFVEADREVVTLQASLTMSAAAAPRTVVGERTKLHEAMRKVLQ